MVSGLVKMISLLTRMEQFSKTSHKPKKESFKSRDLFTPIVCERKYYYRYLSNVFATNRLRTKICDGLSIKYFRWHATEHAPAKIGEYPMLV